MAHKIGEKFGGGIIFYLDESGEHGLIAAPSDLRKFKRIFFFLKKSKRILFFLDAEAACKELDLGGYRDWYLPSKDELDLMIKQCKIIDNLTGYYYWSAMENQDEQREAWYPYFYVGGQTHKDKPPRAEVRAIRAF